MISAQLVPGTSTTPSSLTNAVDIINDSLRVEGSPGQSIVSPYFFNTTRGVLENLTERDTVAALSPAGQSSQVDNTYDVFNAAADQGIALIDVTPANLTDLDVLDLPADVKARITTDVMNGFGAIVPSHSVMLNGSPTIAWAEVNFATGEYIGVDSNGGHEGAFEFLALVGEGLELQAEVIGFFSPVAGFDAGAVLSVSYRLNVLTGDKNDAAAQLKEEVKEAKQTFKELLDTTEDLANLFKKFADESPSKIPEFFSKVVDEIKKALPIGEEGFNQAIDATVSRLTDQETGGDPSITGILSNPAPLSALPTNQAGATKAFSVGVAAGGVSAASVVAGSVSFVGQGVARWNSSASTSVAASSVNAPVATVEDASGHVVGQGSLILNAQSGVSLAVSGSNSYQFNGTGSLSFYGPAESALGVAGDWSNYTATVTGNVSLTVTTTGLTLNSQSLPAGTYTITTSSATPRWQWRDVIAELLGLGLDHDNRRHSQSRLGHRQRSPSAASRSMPKTGPR